MSIFHLDFETSSECDIGLGGYRYASDPSTRILMFAIAEDDGDPLLWTFNDPYSEESMLAEAMLRKAAESESLIYAHNAQFEVAISTYRLEKDVGVKPPALEQWRCTLAMCRRAAAPESLAAAAEFFGLGDQKNPVGKALIGVFCDRTSSVILVPPAGMKDPATIKPLKNGGFTAGKKPNNRKSLSPVHDPEVLWEWEVKVSGEMMSVKTAWDKFCEYCRQDVRVEQELHSKLSHFELKGDVLDSFQFDLRMNWRGVPVNRHALRSAIRVVDGIREKLALRFEKMCGLQPSQRDRKLEWLRQRGYPEDNLQAGTVDKVLENLPDSMTPLAVEVLKMHSLLSFAALAKLPTMEAAACEDGRVRGTMQWHAARTGRAGGRIIQPQNFRKSTIGEEAHVCYTMICDEWDGFYFEEFWESPLEAIASSIRHFIHPHEGEFYDADYAGVEARITPWLAGDTAKLDLILQGVDLYKRTGSMIFGVPYEQITKSQRTDAKPVELGCCIAEGQLVTTQRGEVPIENIMLDDLVWDGVEWVHHEGLIYQGIREVITYQGLTATPDHQVYLEGQEGSVPFGEAERKALRLRDARVGRAQVRKMDPSVASYTAEREPSQGRGKMRVWLPNLELLGRASQGRIDTMSQVQGEADTLGIPSMVGGKVRRCKKALLRAKSQAVQKLWGAWHSIQFPISGSRRTMDDGQPRFEKGSGDRPDRQLGALRAGKFEMVLQGGADAQQPQNATPEGLCVQAGRMALLQGHSAKTNPRRMDERPDHPSGRRSGEDQVKELHPDPKKVRVYDLLNAGPRHRFTVSGKVVSNCFGVGGKGLRDAMAKPPYNLDRTLAQCKEYVKKYREGHPETVQAWRDIEDAAKAAINAPGKKFTACEGRLTFSCGRTAGIPYLTMALPSGRRLYYPHPKVKPTFKKYDEDEMDEEPWKREEGGYWIEQISFYGKLRESNHWGRVGTWGSRLFENAVQAIGADLLNRGCVEAERRGFPICMIVHDQAICESSKASGSLEDFVAALCTKDPWAETFPLEASGAITPYYLKED